MGIYGRRRGRRANVRLASCGSYVVRLYDNNSYRILAESRPFSIVASAAAAINVDQASYSTTGTITASYSGMHGFDHDWIALAQEGAAPTSFERWTYTGGVLSGSATFAAAGLYGRYVARAYFDDGFTIAAESAPFDVNVAQPPVLTTDAPAYTTGATATIAYSGMAGARTDWIAIAKQGSPVTSYLAWAYTYGALTGTVSFPLATIAPSPGAYVARAFFADSFVLQAEAPFTVVSSPVPSGITCTGRQGIATLTETNVRVTARLIVGGPAVYQPYLSIDSSLARAFFGCPQGCPMLVASSVNIPTTTFRSAFFEQPGSGVLGGIELLAPNHPSVTESSTATVDVHWMRSAVEVWCSGTTNLIH